MEYIFIILSFVVIIVSTVGNSFVEIDANREKIQGDIKKKINKITGLGWTIILCGLITTGYTFIRTIKTNAELNWQDQKKKELQAFGYTELRTALNTLCQPLVLLYSCEGDKYPVNHIYKDDTTNSYVAVFQDSSFLAYLDSIKINDTVTFNDPIENAKYSGKNWKELIISHSLSAQTRFNEVWAKYNFYFDLETVSQISNLVNDEFYNKRLLSIRKTLDDYIEISKFINDHSNPPKTIIDSNYKVSSVLLGWETKKGIIPSVSYKTQYLAFIQKCKWLYRKINLIPL